MSERWRKPIVVPELPAGVPRAPDDSDEHTLNLAEMMTLERLDLHGLDRIDAEGAVRDFLEEQFALGTEAVTIMHGIGKGVLAHFIE